MVSIFKNFQFQLFISSICILLPAPSVSIIQERRAQTTKLICLLISPRYRKDLICFDHFLKSSFHHFLFILGLFSHTIVMEILTSLGLFSNHGPLYFVGTKKFFSKMGLACHIAKIHSEVIDHLLDIMVTFSFFRLLFSFLFPG